MGGFLISQYSFALSESSCQHPETPKVSKCEGCPPMFNGKPCASTTWYNDLTKGACGCGNEPNPPDFWTKSKYTAAGNAMMIDPDNPTNSWCTSNCGLCFELCTTGGTHFDLQNAALQITDGLGWNNPEVTWEQVDCSRGDFGDWDADCYCPHA